MRSSPDHVCTAPTPSLPMQPQPTALVSGAGVAGLATAWWLRYFGFDVTVVETAPALRGGGHAVDIRGAALEVVKAMGLHAALQAQRTRLRGMTLLDRDGHAVGHDDTRTFSAGRLDSPDIEIFRDTLCRILSDAAGTPASTLFDERITGIDDTASGVMVALAGRPSRHVDLVVGADGVYSALRQQAFAAAPTCLHPLGGALAFYSAPNHLALTDREWMYRDADLGVVVYPDASGRELRIGAGFGAEVDHALRHDVTAQKALARSKLAGLGGRWRPLVEAIPRADAFYFGELVQVKLPVWHTGRVVLVGDAAHCASPFSGQGTSLALVGAYVLARELSRSPHAPGQAFTRYQTRMQPYVVLNQGLVDLTRQGPVPEPQMRAAADGIALDDLQQP
ncbi:FAD-dependent monooxygenase [Stenotrophomonas sp. HMWF003]|uniref:FAD-dependent monooxygenase n=1 Tax=Stenotrophomonas sp. HMWF003 TaxID=2056840 RepID=UPI000FE218CF|nr:FAD-dependent monooxygenase [Stenotrophomonas sp. HMWF003]